jgi:hypothetical protein
MTMPPSVQRQCLRPSAGRASDKRHSCTRRLRILDAGCGTGYGSTLPASPAGPAAHITGVDFAPSMLEIAHGDVADACFGGRHRESCPATRTSSTTWWSSLTDPVVRRSTRVFGEAHARPQTRRTTGAQYARPRATFAELRAAFTGIDRPPPHAPFSEADAIERGTDPRRLL